MNELYATKVYPVVSHVLDLLDRIGGEAEPAPREVLPRLKQMLGAVEGEGVDRKAVELAKRALVYWVDEVLVNSNWAHAGEWQNNTLERELYDTRDRAWKFFDAARSARAFSNSDPLETFYLCVALGFRGVYREKGFTPPPAPAGSSAAPVQPDQPPSGQGMTWFGDSGMFNPEETWGLGNLPPAAKEQSLLDSGLNPGSGGEQGGAYGLPRTLEEWAGPVFAQVAPPVTKNFLPTQPSERQRDARPLRNRQSFHRAVQILIVSVVATVLLFALWLVVG